MTDDPSNDPAVSSLGETLQSLSDSANSLEADLTELNRVVDDLQVSTERCSEAQHSASQALTRAARNLSVDAIGSHTGQFGAELPGSSAPADD